MRPSRNLILTSGLLLAATAAGCRVGHNDIETWKGTVKGPGKMVAVMLADKYSPELRGEAALALVDMERHDVDGVAELLNALQKLDAPTREQIIQQLTPGLVTLMTAPQPGAVSTTAPAGPPPRQIRA